MMISGVPAKFTIPWANSAGSVYIDTTLPTASQIGVTPGAASLTDGFPPICFVSTSAGGIPPFGKDFNAIFKWITQCEQYKQAGGFYSYDAAFSTAIGGYPQNAILASASTAGWFWVSLVDNNTTNPDTGGVGWVSFKSGSPYSATDTGTANALAISVPAISALAAGTLFIIKKSSAANTGAATLNINALGAVSVVWPDGSVLIAGDWPASVTALLEYDGVRFNVLSFMGPSVFPRANNLLVFPPQTTFYVNFASGSDTTGNGLTTGTAWATIQHAINVISSAYVYSGTITIDVAAGTYTAPAGGIAASIPASSIASWNIVGAGAGSTILNCTATGARGVASYGSEVSVSGISVGAYYECFAAQWGGKLTINNCNISGSSAGNGIASYYAGTISIMGLMTVSGTYSGSVFQSSPGTIVYGYHDINTTNTLAITFSGVTCQYVVGSGASGYSNFYNGYVTFTGTPTGTNFYCATGGGISTGGGGYSYIPATINAGAGGVTSPGWYS